MIVGLFVLGLAAQAETAAPPLMEAGVGGGVFYAPDYPASEEGRAIYLALPYVLYRGKVMRADRDGGVRGQLVDQEKFEVDLSISGAFPANSDDNRARKGMPDLDWIGQIGPRLTYNIWRDPELGRLSLRLPVRYVFSTDFSRLDDRGFLFYPYLEYRQYRCMVQKFACIIGVGASVAGRKLSEYFYGVSDTYATAERPSYRARGGYLGTALSFGLAYRMNSDTRVFFGTQVNSHHGTVNSNSPLFIEKWNYLFGLGFAWRFYESEERGYERH